MFKKKKGSSGISYDPRMQQPAIRQSICSGEMTAGFLDRETGKFHELMLLHGPEEKKKFCESTGVKPEEIKIIY